MKGFGRLTLILGLAMVASVVYIHTWDIAFRKGPLDDISENMKKNAAKIKEAADEIREEQKNRDRNPDRSRQSGTANIDKSLSDILEEKEKSQGSDKKSEEKVKIAEAKSYPSNNQYKQEEINKDKFSPESLPILDNDSIIRYPKREIIDPFSGIVLQTTSDKPGILDKQSRVNVFTKKSIENRDPFANSVKTKNTKAAQKQTNKKIESSPLEDDVSAGATRDIE